MGVYVTLDVVMARKGIGLVELAQEVGISNANLSILKNNKARAIRFSTLGKLCEVLDCQPGDLIKYTADEGGGKP